MGHPVPLAPIPPEFRIREGEFTMARSNAKAAPTGDEEVARGADVPLALMANAAPRDALLDPREGDYVPDNEEKGYHVGVERQPAEPVLTAAGDVHFESLPEAGPSKFDVDGGDLIDKLKAAHNEADAARTDTDVAADVTTTREEALGILPNTDKPDKG